MDFFFSRWFWVPLMLFISLLIYKIGLNATNFENTVDERITLIPDREVRKLWLELSAFNKFIGKIYTQLIGPYFILMSFLHVFALLILNWEIPTIFDRNMGSKLFVSILIVSFCLMNLARGYYSDIFGGFIGLDIKAFKRTIINLYQAIGFQSKYSNNLDKNQIKTISYIDHLMRIPIFMKVGMAVWYGTWAIGVLFSILRIIIYNM